MSARENHPTREKATRRVSPFLAWGDFHARSRFARFTIPGEKWGTTRSLNFHKRSSCFLILKSPTHCAWPFTNLWKPFRLLNLLNEAQVCLCTGTSSSLELLETCSHCPDVRKLGKNTFGSAIQHLVQL